VSVLPKVLLTSLLVLSTLGCGNKNQFKDVGISSTSEVDLSLREANIGAFNLMRITPTNKNFSRIVELVDEADLHVFAGIEIMSTEAADALLEALNRQSTHKWEMILSSHKNGESSYKEWFAFYYQVGKAEPLNLGKRFCNTYEGTESKGDSCYARDLYSDGPDFERDPFVGHFKIGGALFSLVSVHLVYGGQDQESIQRRLNEMMNLRIVADKVRNLSPAHDVVVLGDFNLKLDTELDPFDPDRVKPIVPEDFIFQSPPMTALISEATTIGNSNYDHFFFYEDNLNPLIDESQDTLIDFDTSSRQQKAVYKSEVSDHFLIRTSFRLY